MAMDLAVRSKEGGWAGATLNKSTYIDKQFFAQLENKQCWTIRENMVNVYECY